LSKQIPIDQIKPSPYQPRLTFDLEDIRGSVEKDGILLALTVRERNGFYELIDGERRLRLAKDLGYETVKCDVIDVSDEVARRMTYKVNKERKNYTPEEEARFFKRLVDKEGMKPYQIETQLNVSHHWVQACLNIWKMPKDIQDNVFGLADQPASYRVYLSDIYSLETEIMRNVDDAVAILRQIIEKRMTADEKKAFIGKYKKKINHVTVEKALKKVSSEVKEPESAEELEKAAQALKREAKKKRESQLSKEQKAKRKADFERQKEAYRQRLEEKRKKREEEIRKKVEEETKQKLIQDKDFLQAAAEVASKLTETEAPNELDKVGIPSVPDQIGNFYSNIAKKMTAWKDRKPSQKELIIFVLGFIERQSLSCPVCGEKKIGWKCGHDFK